MTCETVPRGTAKTPPLNVKIVQTRNGIQHTEVTKWRCTTSRTQNRADTDRRERCQGAVIAWNRNYRVNISIGSTYPLIVNNNDRYRDLRIISVRQTRIGENSPEDRRFLSTRNKNQRNRFQHIKADKWYSRSGRLSGRRMDSKLKRYANGEWELIVECNRCDGSESSYWVQIDE